MTLYDSVMLASKFSDYKIDVRLVFTLMLGNQGWFPVGCHQSFVTFKTRWLEAAFFTFCLRTRKVKWALLCVEVKVDKKTKTILVTRHECFIVGSELKKLNFPQEKNLGKFWISYSYLIQWLKNVCLKALKTVEVHRETEWSVSTVQNFII